MSNSSEHSQVLHESQGEVLTPRNHHRHSLHQSHREGARSSSQPHQVGYQESNELSEGANFKEETIQATVTDKEQIIGHFKIVINIERSFLVHVIASIILCILIQFGYFSNPMLEGAQQLVNKTMGQIQNSQIPPKDPLSGIFDYYSVSLMQNILYLFMLYKIIKEDSFMLSMMQCILCSEKQSVKEQASNSPTSTKKAAAFQAQQSIQEGQEEQQHDERFNSTLSIIDSLLQDNLIIQRRNRSPPRQISEFKPSIQVRKQEQLKSSKQDEFGMTNAKKNLYQFEQGIIHHRVNSKKDHITLFNVLENTTETQNFGSKLLVASTTVIFYVYNIAQMNTQYLDPSYEMSILVFLGIPAITMILPFCFVLLTLATSVLFLLIYGISILLLLTYSVISKQGLYFVKQFFLRSTQLKNVPHVMGQTCSICLFEFDSPSEQVSVLKCKHPFHYDCIKLWMQEKDDCPVCRKKC